MQVKFRNLIALLYALLIFADANAQTEANKPNESWLVLDQPEYYLSYPSNWTLDQSGQMGSKFILFADQKDSEFRVNLNLILQDLTGSGFDLDQYVSLSEGQVKSMITNSKIIYSKRIKSGSGEFQEVVFTGDQGVLHLKWKQRYWVKGNKAYVLTFTSVETLFDGYVQVSDKVFNSFKVK